MSLLGIFSRSMSNLPWRPSIDKSRYFLIHAHLAELLLRISGTDRKAVLLRSRIESERHLKLLDSYDLLSREDSKTYEQYLDNPNSFSTASTTDAAARRQTKIARFKEEKALKYRIEVQCHAHMNQEGPSRADPKLSIYGAIQKRSRMMRRHCATFS